MSTDKEPTSLFTAAETKFVLAVLKNMEGGIKVCSSHLTCRTSSNRTEADISPDVKFNKEAVAQELGMKDAGSVGARWNTIFRTKVNGGAATSSPSSAKTNKTAKSVDANEEPQTPTGKKRSRKPKAAGNEDATPTKPSKQARADSVAAEDAGSNENAV